MKRKKTLFGGNYMYMLDITGGTGADMQPVLIVVLIKIEVYLCCQTWCET